MRDLIARLRAALTPQAVALLCALLMLAFMAVQRKDNAHSGTALEERLERTLMAMEGLADVSVVINTRAAQAVSGILSDQNGEEMRLGS